MPRSLSVAVERFPIAGRFTISRGSRTEITVVTATIGEGDRRGRGECVPYSRYGETVEGVASAIEGLRKAVENGLHRTELQSELPAGAARNALDCALWDLDAKLTGVPAHVSAGLDRLPSVTTAYTISLDEPDAMAAAAGRAASRPILKIKLGAPSGDLDRIAAVRRAAPDALLIADANEGWTSDNVADHIAACAGAGFRLIEQPLPAGQDELLAGMSRDLLICADESVHHRGDLANLVGRYDAINIKLDKTGGLTEAIAMAAEARALGFSLMTGCMLGTSLAMAPALIVAAGAQFVDLDGPLLLAAERPKGLQYDGSIVRPPSPDLWG